MLALTQGLGGPGGNGTLGARPCGQHNRRACIPSSRAVRPRPIFRAPSSPRGTRPQNGPRNALPRETSSNVPVRRRVVFVFGGTTPHGASIRPASSQSGRKPERTSQGSTTGFLAGIDAPEMVEIPGGFHFRCLLNEPLALLGCVEVLAPRHLCGPRARSNGSGGVTGSGWFPTATQTISWRRWVALHHMRVPPGQPLLGSHPGE